MLLRQIGLCVSVANAAAFNLVPRLLSLDVCGRSYSVSTYTEVLRVYIFLDVTTE